MRDGSPTLPEQFTHIKLTEAGASKNLRRRYRSPPGLFCQSGGGACNLTEIIAQASESRLRNLVPDSPGGKEEQDGRY